jgi:hypothetical protein
MKEASDIADICMIWLLELNDNRTSQKLGQKVPAGLRSRDEPVTRSMLCRSSRVADAATFVRSCCRCPLAIGESCGLAVDGVRST